MTMRTEAARLEAIRVKAPVGDPDLPICSEVMAADPDPADPDQAVLLNVPFLIDHLNFGDLVRLGPEDECGVRPIVEVVAASGHVHFMAATPAGLAGDLVAELESAFPSYALRIEGANESLITVSVHPDLDPDEVVDVVADFLADDDHLDEEVDEAPAISPIFETTPGAVAWFSASG